MSLYAGFIQLGAGLSVGLAGMAAGFAVGIVGDAGVRASAQQPRLFTGMVCLFFIHDHMQSKVDFLSPIDFSTLLYYHLDSCPHFRRSFGFVRSHRCPYFEH